jgi:hypothetical protein
VLDFGGEFCFGPLGEAVADVGECCAGVLGWCQSLDY